MKSKKIIIIPLLLTLLLGLLPWIFWHLGETKELSMIIIDKTVPNATYREHEALVWLLSNQKIVK